MELTVEVVGMKAFKGFVNGEGINSGAIYARVKMDQRHNKENENFKAGFITEEWKVPDADTIFRMQHLPIPFAAVLEIERVSNGRESREVVLGARPLEQPAVRPAGRPQAADQQAQTVAKAA